MKSYRINYDGLADRSKFPLVVLSGGWDSAAILSQMERWANGDRFEVVHISAKRTIGSKWIYEKRAIEKMLDVYRDVSANGGARLLNYYNVVEPVNSIGWGKNTQAQQTRWVSYVMSVFDPDKHNCIVLGYNHDNGAVPTLDDFAALWTAWMRVGYAGHEPVPVVFPLAELRKPQVTAWVSDHYVPHIWTCEKPRNASMPDVIPDDWEYLEPCGHCAKCRELAMVAMSNPELLQKIALNPANKASIMPHITGSVKRLGDFYSGVNRHHDGLSELIEKVVPITLNKKLSDLLTSMVSHDRATPTEEVKTEDSVTIKTEKED